MVIHRAVAWALAALAASALAAPETIAADNSSAATAMSLNWSGYVAANAYYTGVSALIQTPVATTDRQNAPASVSSWIGIGGALSSDLIQAGVNIDTEGPQTTYSAWYEVLPDNSQTTALNIRPGDWVEVDIHEVDFNLWQIRMADGQQVLQFIIPYPSSHSSAEWIVENPSLNGNLVPLASVHAANFNNMSAIANGQLAVPTQLSAIPMIMIGSDGHPRAVPSGVRDHGDSFTIPKTT